MAAILACLCFSLCQKIGETKSSKPSRTGPKLEQNGRLRDELDIKEVRGKFPALRLNQVFLDNAGGSQMLGPAIEAIRDYLATANVQLGGTYAVGKAASLSYEKAHQVAAGYINATEDEVVLGPSTTQLFRNVSYALNFSEGDELVLSAIEHEANLASWVALAERERLVIKWWQPRLAEADGVGETTRSSSSGGSSPTLLAADVKQLLSDRTRLVALTHASNILGTIHDIKAIAATVHSCSPNALVCVDAVAYAPHRPIDVKDLGVDFYSFSWYKVYGPHMAMLYASPKAREQLRSLGHFFNKHETVTEKLGLAGASYELLSAIPAVVGYLGAANWTAIAKHEGRLQETLLGYLTSRPDVKVWGERTWDPAVRLPTVSFTVQGWSSRELVETVEKKCNAGFRWGAFYSERLVKETLGLDKDGVVRVSMVHYNTVDEVKAFVSALDGVLSSEKR